LGSFCGRSISGLKEWFDNGKLIATSLDINKDFLKIARKEFIRFGLLENISQIEGDSVLSLMSFPSNYFDIIFIDTSHTYEQTIEELYVAETRLKKDGILCGHDLYYPNPETEAHPGVYVALEEFTEDFPKRFFTGIYENSSSSIWAIDKDRNFLNYDAG
jgi:predicted O-methyltransferase YrrM